ncbi:MAG TPA: HlyD family efflux transporter periplasmic adaptor subunit, partial [Bryobacteraceae bacterium]|nr:HlyD family efflux transporter periplasmic adaptor subunit [Bryobacteraceae bacterium]
MLKRVVFGVVIGAALIAAAKSGSWFREEKPAFWSSGTVEGRNIRLGSKTGGRIEEVLVTEGEVVKAGQVLVRFDDRDLAAQLRQSRANLQKMERGSRPEELAEAAAAAAQAKADYEQRKNGYRSEDIAAAEAEVERARVDESRASADAARYRTLADSGATSQQQYETAAATWKMAAAQRQSAQEKLDALRHGYRPEEIASAEARYHQLQAAYEKLLHGNRQEDIDLARAQYAYDHARFREREVIAPSAAVVEVLDVRPGDLIAPNAVIATLLERDQVFIRIYVPETEIGKVTIGQKGELRVDSAPDLTFEAVVEQINQRAEFLPRNVQTREERVHQMFGVKLRIHDPSGFVR